MTDWSQLSKNEKLDYLRDQLVALGSHIKKASDDAAIGVMKVNRRIDEITKTIKPVKKKASKRSTGKKARRRRRVVK